MVLNFSYKWYAEELGEEDRLWGIQGITKGVGRGGGRERERGREKEGEEIKPKVGA